MNENECVGILEAGRGFLFINDYPANTVDFWGGGSGFWGM